MFSTIRGEITNRLLSTRQWFSASLKAQPPASVVSKGLVFVQNYAVYEYTVVSALTAGLTTIKTHSLRLEELRAELLALVLSAEFDSAAMSGPPSRWSKRMALFEKSRGTDQVGRLNFENVFPNDGSHFRPAQLETIWKLLGIAAPVVAQPRHLGRITEMVGHRNAIAHGRSAPDEIGRRFTETEILDRISDTQALCLYIVDTLDLHCTCRGNVER